MKNIKTSFKWMTLLSLLGLFFISILAREVRAISMDSSQYKIEQGNVLSTSSQEGTLQRYDIKTLIEPTAIRELESNGYWIQTGFSSSEGPIPFSLAISNSSIDLGSNLEEKAKQKEITLSVSFAGAGSYTIEAFERGPLQTLDKKNSIPDTKCNGGKDICIASHAGLWTKKALGFGFNIQGPDVMHDFRNKNYFRPFADIESGREPALIVKTDVPIYKRDTTVRFKLLPSILQTLGSYSTIITFVALPSF